jgi:hypothetical protein
LDITFSISLTIQVLAVQVCGNIAQAKSEQRKKLIHGTYTDYNTETNEKLQKKKWRKPVFVQNNTYP